MKSLRLIAALVVACMTAAGQSAVALKSYKDIKYPPLRTMPVPHPQRFELSNGMVVFLLEDHELPSIGAAAMIRAGGRYVPQEKAGLGGITGRVMRSGGTATRKGEEIDRMLDRMGASVETSVGADSASAGMSVLKEDIDKVLPVFADVLRNPAFPQDKIELAKTEVRDAISRRNETSGAIINREFYRLIYGKDSPYARQPEYATVASITRDDLVHFHKQYFQPENVILGVWGDFNAAEMKAKLEKELGSWPKGGNPKPAVPAVAADAKSRTGIWVINKDDVNQSEIRIGALGGKLNDQDYAANLVAAEILGGGFASRLFNRVRTREGLAYSTYAHWAATYDHPGTYWVAAGTKSESTPSAIKAMREEIARLGESEVTDKEMQVAKDSILKGQAFDFDSTQKIVARLVTYEYYGYPQDFLQQTQARIRQVTKADVARVARQYWRPDNLAVVVVGKTSEFGQPLGTDVKTIDITIPQPERPKISQATPQTLDKGKALLLKMTAAHGAAAVADVKDFVVKGSTIMHTPNGAMTLANESSYRMPEQMAQKLNTPMGEMLMVYDGQKMWMKTPQGVQDAPAQAVADARDTVFRETIHLLANAPKLSAQYVGPTKAGDKAAEEILVTDETKRQVRLLIDPQSGILLGKRYAGRMAAGAGDLEEIYTDYKEFNGVKLPVATVVTQNGAKRAEAKIEEVKFNAGVPGSLFTK